MDDNRQVPPLHRWPRPLAWALAGFILFVHIGTVINAQSRLSPTWDEISYPAAGLAQLETGTLSLNLVNPYLSKMIYAVPLLALRPPLPFSHSSWALKEEYRFGFIFTFRNSVPAKKLIAWSRAPLGVFSVLLATVFFGLGAFCWGEAGGIAALLSYATTPMFLARASVAQLEMPVYFFLAMAAGFHILWFNEGKRSYLLAAGFFAGLSLLGKLIGLPALLALVLLEMLAHPRKPAWSARLFSSGLLVGVAAATVVVGTLSWRGGLEALKQVAFNLISFDKILPYYWHERTYENANSLLSWGAFLIKAPLHVLILAGLGAFFWQRSGRERVVFLHLALIAGMSLLSVLFFKRAVSTVQLSPAYVGLVGLTSAVGPMAFSGRKRFLYLASALFAFGAADVFFVHPNYLGYFNRLIGGSDNGYRWSADSDQDWGQSLPELAAYLKKHGEPGVILCYSGSADPEAYGISYQDLLSPALVTRERMDQILPVDTPKIVLVVATKVIQSEPQLKWPLTHLTPEAIVGQSYVVYDVTANAEAFRWMADIYRHSNRNASALWCVSRNKMLEPPKTAPSAAR